MSENKAITLQQAKTLYDDLRQRQENNEGALNGKAPVIINTATGNPAVFSDGADGLPIQSLKVHLLPRQEGTGDPSPENIRPIVPWNGLTVQNGGVNVLNASPSQIDVNGQGALRYGQVFKNSGEYTVINNSDSSDSLIYKKVKKDLSSYGDAVSIDHKAHRVITVNSDEMLFVYSPVSNLSDFCVNVGDNTEYSAYNGHETDIEFSSPVYGGELDVVSGVLTVEWGCVIRDGSTDEPWTVSTSATKDRYVLNKANFGNYPPKNSGVCFCNWLKKSNSSEWGAWIGSTGNLLLYTPMGEFETMDDWRAYLEEKNLQIVYELEQPYTVQLTQAQLQSLLGNNTIWSDANGDIEVEYRADTGLFLKQNTVKDVKVNGSSVLNDGVANVPLASASEYGVVRSAGSQGTSISSGILGIYPATETNIKEATHNYRPIVPLHQHKSVFYGLAKLAGADMANSSNPVGQFTDEAKVAIQKMLGVYEAPWELIREDTVTNETEANIDITVDGNGNQFELTDIAIIFELPKNNDPASKGDYGRIYFYYEAGNYLLTEHGVMTRNADGNAVGILGLVEQKNGMVFATRSQQTTTTNNGNLGWRFHTSVEKSNAFFISSSQLVFNKLRISSVTGTGHYKLYGKRKWN